MRPARLAWIAAVVGLIVAPFLLAVLASRAPISLDAGAAAADEVPALPETGKEGDLFAQLRPLPLFVTTLPDRPSRHAVEAFEDAGILDPDAVRAAFGAAWSALVVDEPDRPRVLDAFDQPSNVRPSRLLALLPPLASRRGARPSAVPRGDACR
ncbi:MAG: hypothetical protein ACRDHO_01380 [Actinomycetota bacterium]